MNLKLALLNHEFPQINHELLLNIKGCTKYNTSLKRPKKERRIQRVKKRLYNYLKILKAVYRIFFFSNDKNYREKKRKKTNNYKAQELYNFKTESV